MELRYSKLDKSTIMLLKYYVTSIMTNAIFYLPTLVYFFTNKLDNPFEVSILISLKSIATFIFEIPTGFVADRYGRKASMLIGLSLNILSLVLLIFSQEFIYFALAQILFGISETFRSGADTALLFDNLKYENKVEKFEKALQTNYLCISFTLVIAYLVGGLIYEVNDKLPFLVSFILLVCAFIMLFTIKEHPFRNDKQKNESFFVSMLKIKEHSKGIWNYVILGNMILGICISSYIYYGPILMTSFGLKGKYFGIVFSLGVISGALCSKLSDKIPSKSLFLKKIAPIVITGLCLMIYFMNSIIGAVAFVILIRLIWGVFYIVYTIIINELVIESSIRATIISIGSGVIGIVSVINTTLLGVFIKSIGARASILFIAAAMIVITILLNVITSNNENKNEIEEI